MRAWVMGSYGDVGPIAVGLGGFSTGSSLVYSGKSLPSFVTGESSLTELSL